MATSLNEYRLHSHTERQGKFIQTSTFSLVLFLSSFCTSLWRSTLQRRRRWREREKSLRDNIDRLRSERKMWSSRDTSPTKAWKAVSMYGGEKEMKKKKMCDCLQILSSNRRLKKIKQRKKMGGLHESSRRKGRRRNLLHIRSERMDEKARSIAVVFLFKECMQSNPWAIKMLFVFLDKPMPVLPSWSV